MISPGHVLYTRLAEAQLAIMLMTRLPAGRINEPVPAMAAASWAFPLAGLVVGASMALVLSTAVWLGLTPAIATGLALAAGVVATGGLHEDGLADTADGFSGGRDRDHKLEIMRDSRIGTFGTLALLLALGLRWSAMAALAVQDLHLTTSAVVAIAIASRAGLPTILLLLPAARSDGLGHDAGGGTFVRAAVALAIGIVAVALLLGPQATLGLVILEIIILWLMARLAMRQIGGQTGDVLGAIQQVAELCAWIALQRLTN